ncbi:hypothetical protein LEMLEM_LOCUS9335, partial [Lemmus lemmus]
GEEPPRDRLQRLHKETVLGAAVPLLVSVVWEERSKESHTEKKRFQNTLWRSKCNCDGVPEASGLCFHVQFTDPQISLFCVALPRLPEVNYDGPVFNAPLTCSCG